MDNYTTSDITRYSTPVYISVNKEPVYIVEIRPTGGVTFSWSKTKKKVMIYLLAEKVSYEVDF